ncbi:preprotein translocase subunit SecG [Rhodobacteraceae bacterium]|nr:preprotein translocase subunit SecG [Paracoccaceae bacterium]
MQNIILTVHLILALLMIGVVLLQRSEGGGLGMGSSGGAGGGGGVMTGRQAANALSKATWVLGAGFLLTSITLTVLAARDAGESSVLDRLGVGNQPAQSQTQDNSDLPSVDLTPPPAQNDAPMTPPAAE